MMKFYGSMRADSSPKWSERTGEGSMVARVLCKEGDIELEVAALADGKVKFWVSTATRSAASRRAVAEGVL